MTSLILYVKVLRVKFKCIWFSEYYPPSLFVLLKSIRSNPSCQQIFIDHH